MKNICSSFNKIFIFLFCAIVLFSVCSCHTNSNLGSHEDKSYSEATVDYTTTFVTNGGTSVSPLKGKITYSPVTTKSGYDFVSWCKDSTLCQPISFPFTPTSNSTFYAKWQETTYPVKSIELNKDKGYVYFGITLQLTATIYPENASDKTLTWSSSNPNCASVDNNGLVTYSGDGSTIITVMSSNGISSSCTVECNRNLVNIENKSGSICRDDGIYGYYSNVTWSNGIVSDDNVYGTLNFKFKSNGGTGTRGGVYILLKDRNGDTFGEYWFKFGMITANKQMNCSKDINVPTEGTYTISIGNGNWYKY